MDITKWKMKEQCPRRLTDMALDYGSRLMGVQIPPGTPFCKGTLLLYIEELNMHIYHMAQDIEGLDVSDDKDLAKREYRQQQRLLSNYIKSIPGKVEEICRSGKLIYDEIKFMMKLNLKFPEEI